MQFLIHPSSPALNISFLFAFYNFFKYFFLFLLTSVVACFIMKPSIIVRRQHFMERKIMNDLLKWKRDVSRKPLFIYGNKQIGKTYTALEFGEKEYKTVAYVNCDNNPAVLEIFSKERTIDKIIFKLSLFLGESILKEDTLIILDNVNDEEIVKGIKKFGKEENDYHIIFISSLKENLLRFKGEELQYRYMFPMDFEEYLRAVGNLELIDFIKNSYKNRKPMPFHSIAMELFENYCMTGGLPEVVAASLTGESDLKIKMRQGKVLDTYKKELLSIPNFIDIIRAEEVLDILPYQLMKTNKKFQYGLMKNGGRSKDYDKALEFLNVNGLVQKCYKVQQIEAPLSKKKDSDSFKLYLNDTGLLSYMMHLSRLKFLTDNTSKYILYENMVANSIVSSGYNLYYYQSDGKAEVAFLVQSRSGKIIPIEIVNKNMSKSKSLTLVMNRFGLKDAIRITEDNFSVKNNVFYVPIYALFCLRDSL